MENRYLRSLSLGKKILLAVAGLMAVGAPIVVGVMASPPSHARSRVPPAAAPVMGPLLALAAGPLAPAGGLRKRHFTTACGKTEYQVVALQSSRLETLECLP